MMDKARNLPIIGTMESNRPTPEALRLAAVERVAYLLRLADALQARDATICRVAANELRAVAEACRIPGGLRVITDSQPDPEGR